MTTLPSTPPADAPPAAAAGPRKTARLRLPHFRRMKERGEPIVMVTAYDHPTACLADAAGAEMVLVGDSLGNVIQGEETTLGVTLDEMIYHTRCVRRGVRRAFLVADMPFLTFQVSVEETVRHAGRLLKEAGAEAVKVEGAGRILPSVEAMVEVGIPVMGHLGLTPQSVHGLGGYRVQGRDVEGAERLLADAVALERAGAFALVLECVPTELGRRVTEALKIPTIGIGAGAACDGQVLVWHDVLGLRPDAGPRFVRRYADLWGAALDGLARYGEDVKARRFPAAEQES